MDEEDYCYACYCYTLHVDGYCTNAEDHEDPTTREPSWLDLPLPPAPTQGETI